MAQVKFYNSTKSKIGSAALEEGAVYIATDTSELLTDLGGKRLTIGKQYANADQSNAGLMSPGDKQKLDGITTVVSGVKGESENAYRTGQVEITKANLGLGNVDNTSDASKTVAKANQLTNAQNISITGGATAAAVSFNGTGAVALNVTSLDATKLSGKVPLDNLPAGALERLYVAQDDAARLKLTINEVQNGDVVKVNATGLMYFVSDDTKLGTEGAFTAFTAGSATSVDWSGISNKPADFPPSAHTHLYAGSASAGGPATKAISDNSGNNIASTYIKDIKANGTIVTFTRGDNTTGTFTTQDNDHTYSKFQGATTSSAGSEGLVPAPASTNVGQFLKGDGTWATPENTTYGVATTGSDGLMSSGDKSKLEGIQDGANKYTHPNHTAAVSGLYKVTVDGLGHVTATTAVKKEDIEALGVGGSEVEEMHGASATTAGVSGLVPTPQAGDNNKFLKGDGTWTVNTSYIPTSIGWSRVPLSSVSGSGSASDIEHGVIPSTDKSNALAIDFSCSYDAGGDIMNVRTIGSTSLPAASIYGSGIVTTLEQTFAGKKTFQDGLAGTLDGNASTATKFNSARTIELTGDITGSVSSDGSSGWTIQTQLQNGKVYTDRIAGSAVTLPKLGNDVGTVAVSSTQPTDSHVLIWIKP